MSVTTVYDPSGRPAQPAPAPAGDPVEAPDEPDLAGIAFPLSLAIGATVAVVVLLDVALTLVAGPTLP